jgi:hypothetical protein
MPVDDGALEAVLDELGIELDVTARGSAIAPLVDQLAQGATREETREAAARVAAETWDDALAARVSRGLEALRQQYRARLAALDAVGEELARPPGENAVALALVVRAAVELWARARKSYAVTAVLEDELEEAPPSEHRSRTLAVASAVIPLLHLDDSEVASAVGRFLDDRDEAWLARTLATDERRAAMRRALAQLADAGSEEFPLAVGALRALLDEPVARDPAEDDLWVNLVVGLAQQHLDFEPG